MRAILKNLCSKLVKRLLPSDKTQETEEQLNIVAFFNIAVNDENELVISSDFLDGHEEAMSKLVFLLCSGSLMEIVGNVVQQRCGDDKTTRDQILAEAYSMMMQNLTQIAADSEDDDNPVVDPCFVFRPKQDEEDEDDTD